MPVDCSEVTLKIAAKECEVDNDRRDPTTNEALETQDCYNNVDWS